MDENIINAVANNRTVVIPRVLRIGSSYLGFSRLPIGKPITSIKKSYES